MSAVVSHMRCAHSAGPGDRDLLAAGEYMRPVENPHAPSASASLSVPAMRREFGHPQAWFVACKGNPEGAVTDERQHVGTDTCR